MIGNTHPILGRYARRLRTSFSIVVLAGIYLPLVVVAAYSFNRSRFGIIWSGVTLDWYRGIWANKTIINAAYTSVKLALTSASISTLLGSVLAFGLASLSSRLRRMFDIVLYIPVVISDVVMGVSLAVSFAWIRSLTGAFQLGFMSMTIAHVTFQIPFVAILVCARLRSLPPSLEEAAFDLGASPFQFIRFVLLPLMTPALLSAFLLALTLSLDDFVISFFTSGPGTTTLPMYIYASVKRGLSPEIHAISTLLLGSSIALTLLSLVLIRERSVNNRRL